VKAWKKRRVGERKNEQKEGTNNPEMWFGEKGGVVLRSASLKTGNGHTAQKRKMPEKERWGCQTKNSAEHTKKGNKKQKIKWV